MNSVLLIRKEHLDKILSGEKSIEIRGTPCKSKINTTIGLAYCGLKEKSNTRVIQATATITGNKLYESIDQFKEDSHLHCSTNNELPYKKTYGWLLDNIKVLKQTQTFEYKKGAIIWVKIN